MSFHINSNMTSLRTIFIVCANALSIVLILSIASCDKRHYTDNFYLKNYVCNSSKIRELYTLSEYNRIIKDAVTSIPKVVYYDKKCNLKVCSYIFNGSCCKRLAIIEVKVGNKIEFFPILDEILLDDRINSNNNHILAPNFFIYKADMLSKSINYSVSRVSFESKAILLNMILDAIFMKQNEVAHKPFVIDNNKRLKNYILVNKDNKYYISTQGINTVWEVFIVNNIVQIRILNASNYKCLCL